MEGPPLQGRLGKVLSTIVLAFAFLCLELFMLAEARHVLPAPGSPVILTAMTLAMSCADLLFVKWRAFYPLPILPFSSLFHVLFQLLLLRRVGWLFSGSWAMFSQRLPWHLHRFYFSCLCLLAARVCQGEKRPNMFPSFAFLWLSPVLGWKGWLFRKGWAGVEGPSHQAEGGTCPLEITFSLLLLSSWR